MSQDFDRISTVYDETRQPLDSEAVDNLRRFLEHHDWHDLLEVGVGTGRIARTLLDCGLRVTGLDASYGMLGRAVQKGVTDLVHGTAYQLPFRDGAFDVGLFVHVLHMLDDPRSALGEAHRVSRHGVLAIVNSPSQDPEARAQSPRAIVRQALEEAGFPDLLRLGPHVKEQKILAAYPPAETSVLSDREITEPVAKQLDWVEKRAYRHTLDVPPEVLARAVATARAKLGDRTTTYRRSEAIVWWPRGTKAATAAP